MAILRGHQRPNGDARACPQSKGQESNRKAGVLAGRAVRPKVGSASYHQSLPASSPAPVCPRLLRQAKVPPIADVRRATGLGRTAMSFYYILDDSARPIEVRV